MKPRDDDDPLDPPAAHPPEGAEPSARPLAAAASPYPMSRLAPPFDLVDAAMEIARADAQLGTVVNARLQVIREQMRSLQDQARAILDDARRAAELHRARCAFKKVPGHAYHLYRHTDGELYFSMLSPADWGGAPPHAYEGSFRLGADMSWTAVDEETSPNT